MGHFILLVRLILMLAAGVLLSHCTNSQLAANNVVAANEQTSAQPADPGGAPVSTDSTAVASAGNAASSFVAATSNVVAPDYQISARDILEVTVFQVPDLSRAVQVADDGNITVPLIGKVPVRGKTTTEAEDLIAQKLKKGYLQSPQVTVLVRQYGQRVTVSGEVKTPKVLSVDGRITLTQAIASAGGLSDLADPNRVHVARQVDQRIRDGIYDLDAIQAGKVVDPVLQGGDLIVAEQSGVRVTIKNLKDLLPFAILSTLM